MIVRAEEGKVGAYIIEEAWMNDSVFVGEDECFVDAKVRQLGFFLFLAKLGKEIRTVEELRIQPSNNSSTEYRR